VEIRESAYEAARAIARHVHSREMFAVPLAGAFELELAKRRLLCRGGIAVTRSVLRPRYGARMRLPAGTKVKLGRAFLRTRLSNPAKHDRDAPPSTEKASPSSKP